jgi:hypothetical protein
MCPQMKQLLLLPKTNRPSPSLARIEVATLFSPISMNCYQAVVRPRSPSNFEGGDAAFRVFLWAFFVAARPHRPIRTWVGYPIFNSQRTYQDSWYTAKKPYQL